MNIQFLIHFVLEYKIEFLLTICLFSNLYSLQIPGSLYYVAIIAMPIFMYRFHARATHRTRLSFLLMTTVILSSIISGHAGMRMVFMSYILFITLAYSSEEFYHFKFRFMYISLIAYAFTSIINIYAKYAGVNIYNGVMVSMWGASTIEFSGYTCHPMWLSAACGIGTIFFLYAMIVVFKRGRKKATLLFLAATFGSLWITMQGGSRSASGISVICCLFLILNAFESATQKKKLLLPIIFVGLLTLPSMVTDNAQFARKQGGIALVDENGENSRSRLWAARLAEFYSSPILGVGFGVIGIGDAAAEGRAETGSGWLTALAQTGIIGFVLVCMLVYKARLPKYVLKTDSTAALMEAVMLFLCLHSLFEAYMFQAGWYMCFVFWLLVSVLDDYKTYGPIPELEDSLFGEREIEEDEDDDEENI